MNKRTITILTVIIVAIFAIIIGWFIYSEASKSGKVPIEIVVIPNDAAISLNDQVISNKSTYLAPGTYLAQASKEGFNTVSQEVIVTEGSNQKITLALTPNSPDAQKWAKDNMQNYLDFEGIEGDRVEAAAAKNEGTILSVLPYHTHLYSIGTRPDESRGNDTFFVTVRAPEVYRESAIEQIKNLGFNPAEYNIDFINYRNPFNE